MATSLGCTTLSSRSPKELFKKATEPTGTRKKILCATEVEPDVLIARWRCSPTLLCRLPGSPIAVILGAFVRVFEDFVGLTDVFKFFLGVWGFVDIRMVLASELTIGPLNFFLGGVFCNPQGGIIIFEFHLAFSSDAPGMWAHWHHDTSIPYLLLPGQGPPRTLPAIAASLGNSHLDLARLGLLGLGQIQGQHAALQIGRDPTLV